MIYSRRYSYSDVFSCSWTLSCSCVVSYMCSYRVRWGDSVRFIFSVIFRLIVSDSVSFINIWSVI